VMFFVPSRYSFLFSTKINKVFR